MENLDSLDILIESVKYTSEIIINITEKLNSLEMKIANIEQIVNDQLKIGNKNIKILDYHDKLIKELFAKNNQKKSSYIDDESKQTNETKKIIENNTDSVLDFSIIQQKEYKVTKNEVCNNLIEEDEDENKNKTDILIEKLLTHKKNLENQISKEQQDFNSKKINTSNEKVTRTTQESLINRRKTNVFRKI